MTIGFALRDRPVTALASVAAVVVCSLSQLYDSYDNVQPYQK